MKAYWTEDAHRDITSVAELDAVITDVRNLTEPRMLFLEQEDGSTLVVGFSATESVLTYVDAAGSSYHSVGDTERAGVLKFWCREQLDDFLAEMAVPAMVAVDAAYEFYTKGTRPSNLTWEGDW
jgi:hypothetical protein